jgi:transcription elongation factor GreA
MGSPGSAYAVATAWRQRAGEGNVDLVATAQTSMPRGEDLVNSGYPRAKGVVLSSSDFAGLMDELESLRARIHAEGRRQSRNEDPNASVAERTASLLAALERAVVDPARVAEVAALIELASALDDVATVCGAAGLGSIVKVADRAGRTSEYELIGRPDPEAARQKVILASPNGKALLGARPGDSIQVTLVNGRQRRVRVIDVTPKPLGLLRAAFDGRDARASPKLSRTPSAFTYRTVW